MLPFVHLPRVERQTNRAEGPQPQHSFFFSLASSSLSHTEVSSLVRSLIEWVSRLDPLNAHRAVQCNCCQLELMCFLWNRAKTRAQISRHRWQHPPPPPASSFSSSRLRDNNFRALNHLIDVVGHPAVRYCVALTRGTGSSQIANLWVAAIQSAPLSVAPSARFEVDNCAPWRCKSTEDAG